MLLSIRLYHWGWLRPESNGRVGETVSGLERLLEVAPFLEFSQDVAPADD